MQGIYLQSITRQSVVDGHPALTSIDGAIDAAIIRSHKQPVTFGDYIGSTCSNNSCGRRSPTLGSIARTIDSTKCSRIEVRPERIQCLDKQSSTRQAVVDSRPILSIIARTIDATLRPRI